MPIRKELRKFYTRAAGWTETRLRILKRAGNCCERCGGPNGEVIHGRKIQLGVAHLDHDPSNNDDTNLAALCRRCHLLHDRPQHKRTRSDRKDRARPLLQAIRQYQQVE